VVLVPKSTPKSTQLRRRNAWTAVVRAFMADTPGIGRRVGAIPRMIGATMRGEYDGKSRLAMMAVSAAYIVSPIDLVPEAFLLFLGLVDDAAVAAFLAGALLDETERFLEWERNRDAILPAASGPSGARLAVKRPV
jgi:uncharacterized membrane protein YkvA (DUF1232 family)